MKKQAQNIFKNDNGTVYCYILKILRCKSLNYRFKLITTGKRTYDARNTDIILQFNIKRNIFKCFFFPSIVIEWKNLDINMNQRNIEYAKNAVLTYSKVDVLKRGPIIFCSAFLKNYFDFYHILIYSNFLILVFGDCWIYTD